MFDYEKDRLARLREVLRSLELRPTTYIRAKRLKEDYLTGDGEYEQYRASLTRNRQPVDAPELSPAAQDYWDAFRALCRGVNLARNAEQRKRLVDEAAELMDRFAEMPPSDRGRFRTLDLSRGDVTWASALHELEHDLPFLDEDAARPSHLDHAENFTQRQFLADLIEQLDPPEQHRSTPQEVALVKQRSARLRSMVRRLSR